MGLRSVMNIDLFTSKRNELLWAVVSRCRVFGRSVLRRKLIHAAKNHYIQGVFPKGILFTFNTLILSQILLREIL